MHEDYTIALYIRISSEDGNDGESNSIKHQRDLLTDFVKRNFEFKRCNFLEFCDDGYSGVNFDRPNVKTMLRKARTGDINCIVVKDFSRFGRNYIEVGDYIEQVFPFLGVRFISVNDNFDSDNGCNSIGGLEVALRALIYDLYSKDLSQKVKSALKSKKSRGESISPFAIYGYFKASDCKNKLAVDDEAAKVVRQIFELAITGKRAMEIAKILNAQNTPTRNKYKSLAGSDRDWCKVSKIGAFWKDSDIRSIVADKRYTGTAVGNMYERKCIGRSGYRLVPKEDWIVVPNAHEAIVTLEEYEMAQRMLKPAPRKKTLPKERILYNKVRCHNCNHAMRRSRGNPPSFLCSTPVSIHSPNCFQGKISETVIEQVLLSAIQTQAKLFNKSEQSREKQRRVREVKLENIQKTIKQLEETIQKLNVAKHDYYESYKDDKISKDEFLSNRESCNQQIEMLNANIAELAEKLNNGTHAANQSSTMDNEWKNSNDVTKLNKEIVDTLVDSIIVYDSECIEILWKHADEFSLS